MTNNKLKDIEKQIEALIPKPVLIPIRKNMYKATSKLVNGSPVPLTFDEMDYVLDDNGNIQYMELKGYDELREFFIKFIEQNL